MCGEKIKSAFKSVPEWGSPPRVRGKAKPRNHVCILYRITPACAGKSSVFGLNTSIVGDHPRVCGEKYYKVNGSAIRTRITPACAGKRVSKYLVSLVLGDHPRVCGEKTYFCASIQSHQGSPPRVRGKDPVLRPRMCCGITPACAGKRPTSCVWSDRRGDHPRVCGEKCICSFWYAKR